ncbi:MAG: T9SS type A sorting domain-containing protein [Bacteroidetes bacterium]|nr:T9SS type A sorting domain-containing protein [Bacteroidota bacterium]
MKKHSTTLVLALAATGTLMAQHPSVMPAGRHHALPPHPSHQASAQRADPIWQDDFSNAATWTFGTLGLTTNNWVIGTTAPSGTFAIPAIQSTTAANGFALYDSDLMCGSDSGYIQNATPIDLSAYPYVVLQFEEFYRNYQGHTWIQVSNNGTDWTQFQVNATLASNASTANPTTISLPITSVAGGQPTVWIRFLYAGDCDYAWMVDDVALYVQDNNDLTIDAAKTTMWDYVNTVTFDSLPYTVFPVSEIRAQGLNMTFSNNGALPAVNTTARIHTSDGYDDSQGFGDLAPAAADQFVAAAYTPTSALGDHSIYYSIASDSTEVDEADNADTLVIGISNYAFARDNGSRTGGYNDTDDGTPFKLANAFHVRNAQTLYGIDVAFSSASETGSILTAEVLANDANFTPIAETMEHELAPEDLSALGEGRFVSFIFEEGVPLTAGTDYLVAVRHFGGSNVLVGTSGISPAQTSFIYQESSDTWFYVTSTPMVRMNFNPTVGIAENDIHNGIGLGQNYPNPAGTGSTRIDLSLEQAAQVTLDLRDVSGKLVRMLLQGNMAQGLHRVDVNTADLEAGVYFYTLTTGSTVSSKRMTVVH